MIVLPQLGPVTSFQLPEDAAIAKQTFLDGLAVPVQGWLRAYAFTLLEAATAVKAAHSAGSPRHLVVDSSCMADPAQKTIVEGMVAGGVEVTISTSAAGASYISHEKTWCDADGNVFTGSTNWSDSAWLQTNKSLVFNSPAFVAQFVESFNAQVAWAWLHERSRQLLSEQPASSTICFPG